MAHLITLGPLPTVQRATLRWVYEQWRAVERFIVTPARTPGTWEPDVYLVAQMSRRRVYLTTFASVGVLRHWLARSNFRGKPVEWL